MRQLQQLIWNARRKTLPTSAQTYRFPAARKNKEIEQISRCQCASICRSTAAFEHFVLLFVLLSWALGSGGYGSRAGIWKIIIVFSHVQHRPRAHLSSLRGGPNYSFPDGTNLWEQAIPTRSSSMILLCILLRLTTPSVFIQPRVYLLGDGVGKRQLKKQGVWRQREGQQPAQK